MIKARSIKDQIGIFIAELWIATPKHFGTKFPKNKALWNKAHSTCVNKIMEFYNKEAKNGKD